MKSKRAVTNLIYQQIRLWPLTNNRRLVPKCANGDLTRFEMQTIASRECLRLHQSFRRGDTLRSVYAFELLCGHGDAGRQDTPEKCIVVIANAIYVE